MASRSVKRGRAGASVSRIGQRRQVVIPKALFDSMGLAEEDFMEVTAERGRLSLKPKKKVDADDALTQAEVSKMRHGLKQVRDGKTRPWSQVKNALGL